MDLLLQIWGGSFYLTNKICFALAEGSKERLARRLKIIGWSIYIAGVPAWVIILVGKHNWIAASIEAGGVPAMMLGLYTVVTSEKPHKVFEKFVTFCTYGAIAFGVSFSLAHHDGITSVAQVLEAGVMVGFLMGSYLLAKQNNSGWLFFMLMNLSMATLMMLQGKPILMAQQLMSLGFVLYGYCMSIRTARNQVAKPAATEVADGVT